ncbi:CLUMA_CG012555, isoform A [Clunio marinus]|uniref:CLUMA_CG012555, isoform A n=1 Tax=Clunio marinus TaxID=568069 RepID=A0A1J1IHP4_9DIPT|nr:CLUMA_CG012555, isoform A [Clunio marinus]
MNKKDTDKKTKLIQEKCNTILTQLLRDEDNKYCCDCDSKGPRWASWNLGIFLCIRCAGIHRNLGVHISRVKSVNLDTWAPEQVVSLQQMGNSRARAVYEALLSDNFRRPQTDSGLESFIRAKYEHKKYIAREWIPPPPITKVDWDKDIEEELENQRRKKKTTCSASSLSLETSKPMVCNLNVQIPAPLRKPHPVKNARSETKKVSDSMDLLGLDITSSTTDANKSKQEGENVELKDDQTFDFFMNTKSTPKSNNIKEDVSDNMIFQSNESSLKTEEEDFFNQKTLENGHAEKEKLTKDRIMALYGNGVNLVSQHAQPFQTNFQQLKNPTNDQFFAYPQQQPSAPFYNHAVQQNPMFPQGQPNMFNNNSNLAHFPNFGFLQAQQSKLNEENIKKIESLNINHFDK